MNPEPHCKVKSWRFKPDYVRKNHLGPEGRLKAKRKAVAEYEMMAACPVPSHLQGRGR